MVTTDVTCVTSASANWVLDDLWQVISAVVHINAKEGIGFESVRYWVNADNTRAVAPFRASLLRQGSCNMGAGAHGARVLPVSTFGC
jgi:hypothetical protein